MQIAVMHAFSLAITVVAGMLRCGCDQYRVADDMFTVLCERNGVSQGGDGHAIRSSGHPSHLCSAIETADLFNYVALARDGSADDGVVIDQVAFQDRAFLHVNPFLRGSGSSILCSIHALLL